MGIALCVIGVYIGTNGSLLLAMERRKKVIVDQRYVVAWFVWGTRQPHTFRDTADVILDKRQIFNTCRMNIQRSIVIHLIIGL